MSIYLLLGSEAALAERALGKLTAQLIAENIEVRTIFCAEALAGDISEALAPSLFSEKRALILRELQDLPLELQSEVIRYLEELDPNVTLIFLHKGGVKGKALLDRIKKAPVEVIACDVIKKESEKQEFVRAQFLDLGRKATPAAVAALVSAIGSDMRELSAACSQLASDTKGIIDEEVVNAYHRGRIESTGFDVADAALEGNLPAALLALRSALATGTDPVMVVSAIAAALRALAKVSGANRGAKSFELAGTLGMAPWQVDKARRQLTHWAPGAIAAAVAAIATADAAVKGAAVDPIYALERAVGQIAGARSRS